MQANVRIVIRWRAMPRAALAAAALFVASPALAQPGGFVGEGLVSGFAHPFSGIDHILAMVGLGVWVYRLGPPTMRLLPALCVLGMSIGGALAAGGVLLPGAEAAIVGSTILLWALVLLGGLMAPPAAGAFAVLVSILHGHVHGLEMSVGTHPLLYGAGLLCGSCLLYLGGMRAAMQTARAAGYARHAP